MDIATLTKILSAALAIIMLGLGLHLTTADFARVFRYPKAAFIALFCQLFILPAAAFALAKLFDLAAMPAVGLMLLAASPGGVTANLYSHLFKGDVALNITLTAVNSLLSLVTLPLIVTLSIAHFMAVGEPVPVPTAKIIQVFAIVLLPVTLGMLVKHFAPASAQKLDKPVKILSVVSLLLAIGIAVFEQRDNLATNFQSVGLVMLIFNVLSLALGYLGLRFFGVNKAQSIAGGMEIGIHNGTLAIAIAITVLGKPLVAMPAAVYSILMFITAAIFGYIATRKDELNA